MHMTASRKTERRHSGAAGTSVRPNNPRGFILTPEDWVDAVVANTLQTRNAEVTIYVLSNS